MNVVYFEVDDPRVALPSGFLKKSVLDWLDDNVSPSDEVRRYRSFAYSDGGWLYVKNSTIYGLLEEMPLNAIKRLNSVPDLFNKRMKWRPDRHCFLFDRKIDTMLFKLSW